MIRFKALMALIISPFSIIVAFGLILSLSVASLYSGVPMAVIGHRWGLQRDVSKDI